MPKERAARRADRRARDVWVPGSGGAVGVGAGLWLGIVVCLCPAISAAQISPPGLGTARAASWTAFGVRQDVDPVHRRESLTYVGVGTISHPNNGNPFEKPAIFVLNEELFDNFRRELFYSAALSYRRQNRYQSEPPYARAEPPARYELRLYGRFGHVLQVWHLKLKNTFRSELRTFFARGLDSAEEVFEFRLRFKTQATWTVDPSGRHRLMGSVEVLAAKARERNGDKSGFAYRESRFCLYYAIHPRHAPIVLDIGYMNNLLGSGASLVDVHYLALDLVWKNPFGTPKAKL